MFSQKQVEGSNVHNFKVRKHEGFSTTEEEREHGGSFWNE